MDIIKKRWKEICIILGIILAVILIFILINFLLGKRQEALEVYEVAEKRYNNIMTGETSETVLNEQLNKVLEEKAKMQEILPADYKIQDANGDLREIIRNTKILNIGNCGVVDLPVAEGDKYKKIEIRAKNFYGTYNQIKDFMDYIKNYGVKIVIKDMEFQREATTNNMKGQNLVLILYGAI